MQEINKDELIDLICEAAERERQKFYPIIHADTITCPYCEFEVFETATHEGERRCSWCEKVFAVERHVTITYSSYPKEVVP